MEPAAAATAVRRVIMPASPPRPPLILAKSRARRFRDGDSVPISVLAGAARRVLLTGGWWSVREMAREIANQGFRVGHQTSQSAYRRLTDAVAVMEEMDLVRCMVMQRRDPEGAGRCARHYMWIGNGNGLQSADLAEAVTDARRRALAAEATIAKMFLGQQPPRQQQESPSQPASVASGGEERSTTPSDSSDELQFQMDLPPLAVPRLNNGLSNEEFAAMMAFVAPAGTLLE